jgi:subtilase family serine protease
MKIWKETGRATATDVKTFTVGMVMKDVPLLEATLLELATPSSPRYGKWLTKEEADELTSTPAPIAAEVTRWATSTGAACKRRSEALSCSGTVSQIEKLLGGELSYFVSPTRARAAAAAAAGVIAGLAGAAAYPRPAHMHSLAQRPACSQVNTKDGEKIIRTSMHAPGSIPSSLAGKVTIMTGLTQFPMGQRTGTMRPEAAYRAQDTDYSVVPETLNILYNHPTDDSSNAISAGPIEFQN